MTTRHHRIYSEDDLRNVRVGERVLVSIDYAAAKWMTYQGMDGHHDHFWDAEAKGMWICERKALDFDQGKVYAHSLHRVFDDTRTPVGV